VKAKVNKRQKVQEMLDIFDLPKAYAHRSIDQLSGARQRVALARAIINRPESCCLIWSFIIALRCFVEKNAASDINALLSV